MENAKKILIVSPDKNLLEVLNFCLDGWGYEVFLREEPLIETAPIKKLSPDVIILDVHSASKFHLEICRLLKDDFLTAFIPVITLINKRQLRTHLLNLKQGVDDYLIKPPDPLDLRIRLEMAVRRSQFSFYANPLTCLPGGRIVEETLKEKLKKDTPFTFGYIDIDNFKYFNDVYGYLKGDMAIMQTAYLLYTVVKQCGNPNDFIGHIGGDDFVFITTPGRYKTISGNFILLFDKIMPLHYSSEDRINGYITARDRTRAIKEIPLMSVSLALVNRNNISEFKNVVQINERIAEIKRYLKTVAGSKFMADRRNIIGDKVEPLVNKKEEAKAPHKPLGQILLERHLVSPEQLDEALKIHWKRGIVLGDALLELKLVREEELDDALKFQNAH